MCPHFSEPSYWVVSSRDLISKCGKIGKRSTYPILSQATYTIIERNHQSINTLCESTLQNWAEKRKVDRKKQNQGHDMLICHSKLGESFEWKDDHGDTASNITHNTGRDNWAVRSTDLGHEVTESETNAQRRVICVCCLLNTWQKVYSIHFKGEGRTGERQAVVRFSFEFDSALKSHTFSLLQLHMIFCNFTCCLQKVSPVVHILL